MTGFERLQELVAAVAKTGRGQRGVSRLALTESDLQARRLIIAEMESLGMKVRLDGCCNIWGCLEAGNDKPGAVIGSHLDSVPEGGDYDGVLGVCAGLAAVRDIVASGTKLKRSLTVAVFTSEESSRFSLSCVGSKAASGYLTLMDTLRFKDRHGVSLLQALRGSGGAPEKIRREALSPASYHSYFELHIEQGPVLDWSGENVGIVEAIAAPTRFMLDLKGEQAHSGACPMHLRHDALAAAAEIILAVEKAGQAESGSGSVATVGVCDCSPSAMNVVPGHVVLKVDIRGIHEPSIQKVLDEVLSKTEEICSRRCIQCARTMYSAEKPVAMDRRLIRDLEKICQEKKVAYRVMPSGAGHDAMYMAALIPSALIFVPCRDGISHNPDERVDWDRLRPGYDVLLQAVSDIVAG